jgi:histidyl-tRNA synthetase
MYRPWWFPEFSPREQYTFDEIVRVVNTIFSRYNYHRIRTPAVEPTEILLKGGDVAEQQIYWLFGLAQWIEDVKSYALHFDLTVPFARYVLDHRNELTFPFSRSQIQPVWRWERTKRWRTKEFRQMDVDTVWPSDMKVGTRYDVQSISVMDQVMKTLCNHFEVSIDFIAKVSHLWLTKAYLEAIGLDETQRKATIKVLDNYFKRPHAESMQALDESVWEANREKIEYIINTKDYSSMEWLPGYDDLIEMLTKLTSLGVTFEYDICIVRWQNYYSGMVVERLDRDDIELGSLAGGGRYDNLTDFIDPKQSFSGVWTSLGRFTYVIMEKCTKSFMPISYLFVNFEDTQVEALELYNSFIKKWLTSAMYPTPAKLAKQFEYADRSGFTYCIVYGSGEKEQGVFKQKNMQTGEEQTYDIQEFLK